MENADGFNEQYAGPSRDLAVNRRTLGDHTYSWEWAGAKAVGQPRFGPTVMEG